ncbi:MAG: class I SAM-dependent methyltransferase [Methanosarcinaceae archaeon]|nr:class I SAM-dependent methyltransferase [Methanosarcinaceae archaeon]
MEINEYSKMDQFEQKYWWWVVKRLIVDNQIKKLSNTSKILEVGCGTGTNLKSISKYGDVTGIDFSKNALDFCKRRTHNPLILADAEKLPIDKETFDLIVALDVIEHLNDEDALSEFYRILKPNGFLIITVPAFKFLWSQHDDVLHHLRRYRKKELKNKLEHNFSIRMISYWNFFMLPPITAIRLINKIRKTDQNESDVKKLPFLINYTLIKVMRFEDFLISNKINLPCGVSIIAVCEKKD